jgi:hypothetical protein
MMKRKRARFSAGFTLPETLISLGMCSLIVLFSSHIFRANHKVFVEQEEVIDMQQNGRIAVDRIVRDLRIAGSGLPIVRVSSDVGFLYPVMPGDGGGNNTDTLKILANFEDINTHLTDPMPDVSSALKVADASAFAPGKLVVVYGATLEGGVSGEAFRITHLSEMGQDMLHGVSYPWNENQALDKTYLPPSGVSAAIFRKYYVDTGDSLHPKMVVSENEETVQVLADNIEKFQVVYDLITGQEDVPNPSNPLLIKKVTVTVVARTDTPDPNWTNGIHSITGVQDNYRRFALEVDIQLRNLRRRLGT